MREGGRREGGREGGREGRKYILYTLNFCGGQYFADSLKKLILHGGFQRA